MSQAKPPKYSVTREYTQIIFIKKLIFYKLKYARIYYSKRNIIQSKSLLLSIIYQMKQH